MYTYYIIIVYNILFYSIYLVYYRNFNVQYTIIIKYFITIIIGIRETHVIPHTWLICRGEPIRQDTPWPCKSTRPTTVEIKMKIGSVVV